MSQQRTTEAGDEGFHRNHPGDRRFEDEASETRHTEVPSTPPTLRIQGTPGEEWRTALFDRHRSQTCRASLCWLPRKQTDGTWMGRGKHGVVRVPKGNRT